MKRVLLVGSSFSAAPIFFLLKKRGFHVSVCGSLKTDPCHKYADESYYIDYSDRDELLRLVELQNFDFIVPTCNDYSYIACAWVAECMGYPGFDNYRTAVSIHTKNEFRYITEKFEILAPRAKYQQSSRLIDSGGLNFPLLVKPTDSFSGRGVVKVFDYSELDSAVAIARQVARDEDIVLEEYVHGNLHSHSAFIRNGKVAAEFFVDEFCTVYSYQVNCSNHPSKLSASIQANIRATIERLVECLGLKDGLLHTQFIANAEQYWIIECMRRCPGDLYGDLIERSTGVGYMDLYLSSFLNEEIELAPKLSAYKAIGRHTISANHSVATYAFSHSMPSTKVHIVPLKGSGDLLEAAPYDKLAILFFEFNDSLAMFEMTPKLAEFVSIQPLQESYFDN